ncbi:MAG: hypothetical protein LBN33_08195, partial [Desulfovibrio sp.]|nr:hypothetical protein [Desulfovibrio sp.]
MQLHLPSQFVCVLLLPCAYCYSSNFVAFIKNLTFGKHFFYDLIKHKKKIGKVFSSHSNLLSVPSAFLYRTALFLYYNGGGGQAIIKLFDHLQKRGVIQTCSLAATQLQRLFVDEDNKNNRILIIWDGIFRHNNYPLHFFYLLSLASFQLELFIGNATIPYCTVSLLRKHGVRLVRSINKNPSATEYLYEFGHTYHNFFIFSDVISHKLVDCMLYVSHGARIICYSSDSKSYNKIHEDISAKLYCIVSKHPEVHLHQGVRFALLPDIQPYMPLSQQFQMMLPLCRKCGLLPVKLFTKFFSERPFPRIFPTRPIITFVVRASIKHDHTKAVFVSLSEAAEHAGLPWEIVTTSDEAAKKTIYPEYIRVLPDKFSSLKEHIIHAVDVARGELIFFVDSNMFLYEGLPEIFEHFQHTPDARICGCNITDSNDMLLHAGALL